MLYLDNNAEIRDLFREVDGVSQHGLDELFDQDVRNYSAGRFVCLDFPVPWV